VLISSETSVLTRTTWRNTPEDAILHSHRRENLKSYTTDIHWRHATWLRNRAFVITVRGLSAWILTMRLIWNCILCHVPCCSEKLLIYRKNKHRKCRFVQRKKTFCSK
jgi:hypothetical protein